MSMKRKNKTRSRYTRRAMFGGAAIAALSVVTTAGADLTPEELEAARNHAFQLNAQGRCLDAMPIWEQLGRNLGRAADFLDAANCAMENQDASRAVSDLWEVIRRREQLSTEQQLYALRSLGFQAEALDDWSRALIGWDYAAQTSDEPLDYLYAARAARMSGRTLNAQTRLMQIQAGSFEGPHLAMYYNERAQVMREAQPQAAAAYMARAISIDDQPWRRFDHGLMLQQSGDTDAAIGEFRTALAADPDNSDIRLSLAYALRQRGQNDEAATLFQQAIQDQPERADLREDLAYALKDAGRNDEAAQAFMGVVDILSRNAGSAERDEHLYRVRREITELERHVTGHAYISWRDEGVGGSTGLQNPDTSGSVGGELAWRPDALFENGKGVSLFARGYAGLEPGSFSIDGDSLQLGVGARWKPFEQVDFSLSGERLVAGGDTARDDWLLRASYGWTDGYDWEPVKTSWNYSSVYADLAYIPGDNEYFGAYAQVRQGRRFRTGEGWAVTPYVTAVGQYSEDVFGSQEQFQAGPGVSVSHWFDEDQYHAYRRRVDFDVEYLFDIDGGGDGALMARVVFSF
jgi:adsorption protein A